MLECISELKIKYLKNLHTVWQSKVFEVDVGFWIQFSSRLDKGIHKVIVLFTSCTRLLEAKIQLIIEKFLIVSATIKDYRKGSVGMDTSAQGSQDKFCNRDENTSDTLITDAQDLFSVCPVLASHIIHAFSWD